MYTIRSALHHSLKMAHPAGPVPRRPRCGAGTIHGLLVLAPHGRRAACTARRHRPSPPDRTRRPRHRPRGRAGSRAARDRPGADGRAHRRHRGAPRRPHHLVRRGRLRGRLEDRERGHLVDAHIRRSAVLFHRRCRHRSVDPDIVWVGTGENVSGRHVAWGDGVYRSRDGGRSWQRMGLAESEHIGKILVDPRDGDVVFVAAEGPLWSTGGRARAVPDGGRGGDLGGRADGRREHRR